MKVKSCKKRKVQVERLLDAGVRSEDWQERNGYTGVVPEQAVFCDGGMLSNFPIRLFHQDWVEDGRPLLPTIGVQLGSAMLKTEAVDVSGAGGMLGSVLDTARRNMDRTSVKENQAYKETLAVSEWVAWWDGMGLSCPARQCMCTSTVSMFELLIAGMQCIPARA